MLIEPPPMSKTQSPQGSQGVSFQPGYLNQDIFTLPLEIGLIGSLNYFYNPRAKTFFPIPDEATDKSNSATTYTRSALLPYAIGTGALIFSGLTLSNDDFHIWTQARGFAHALLLSEVAATAAKVTIQKKRPNYDAQLERTHGEDTSDSRASFYSDHANQAFAFTTYTSLLMFKFSNSVVVSSLYSVSALTAASIISYSRAHDHAHNLSDVIVGAIMGSTISALTFFRVQEVDAQFYQKKTLEEHSLQWNMTPGMARDESGKTWYTADINLEI